MLCCVVYCSVFFFATVHAGYVLVIQQSWPFWERYLVFLNVLCVVTDPLLTSLASVVSQHSLQYDPVHVFDTKVFVSGMSCFGVVRLASINYNDIRKI